MKFSAALKQQYRKCNYHIQAIRHIHLLTTELWLWTVKLSRLDYCNAVLHGAPAGSIQKLQRVYAARHLRSKCWTEFDSRDFCSFVWLYGWNFSSPVLIKNVNYRNWIARPLFLKCNQSGYSTKKAMTLYIVSQKPSKIVFVITSWNFQQLLAQRWQTV